MSILTIEKLTHYYDQKVLFDEADLNINNGEHVGIVGLNGAGKSTFMNIIAGITMQDDGQIKWLNGIRWGYLDQHADIDRTLTVMQYLESSFIHLFELNEKLENMYAEMATIEDTDILDNMINKSSRMQERLIEQNFYDLDSNIKKIANGLGINNFGYDTLVSTLSGGQRAKLMLAKLLLDELDVMLLDEPTNFLDIEHIEWLANFLDTFKGSFILVSHDTSFLNRTCKVIVNIENSQIKKYAGNYDTFMSQREDNAKQYADNYEKQQREIKKMEEYIAKNKARAATAGMANARKKMLEKIEVIKKPIIMHDAFFEFPYTELITKNMIIVKDLEIGYNGKPLLPPINFTLGNESKIWIRGTNGIGKSTLVKTIMRKLPVIKGSFKFHPLVKVGYLEQDVEFKNSMINAVSYMNEIYPSMNQKVIRTELAKAGIKNDLATKALSLLSGGEQVRIRLCVLMQKETNLLILDEPTNHLDVKAKDALLLALKNYKGALILVSHELDFAGELCNDIFDVKN